MTGLSVGSSRVILAAHDVERYVRLVADHPAVMSRRHVEEVARLHDALLAVVHLHRRTAADHEPHVLDHAGARPRRLTDVLGPLPARLVGGAADRHRADRVELEAPAVERARL